jgi:hypothetical protein
MVRRTTTALVCNIWARRQLQRAFAQQRIEVAALFLSSERDPCLAIPGMDAR